MEIIVRSAAQEDGNALCSILNEIIDIGGTTAFETRLALEEFQSIFLDAPNGINTFIAERDGLVLGFQSLLTETTLPQGWVNIATFARQHPKVKGVGSRLFSATHEFSRAENYDFINATIRADNQSGLAYYSKMGFEDYSIAKDVPLKDGTLVDRIRKKFKVSFT